MAGGIIILDMCTKNQIIWGTVPEIRSERQNFLSFWAIFCPFTALLTPKIKIWEKMHIIPKILSFLDMYIINEGQMMYGSWNIKPDRQSFLSFWVVFYHLTWTNLKNQYFEKKKKKKSGDIILHKCTKNHDHMLYCSWDMERDRCNCYFSF